MISTQFQSILKWILYSTPSSFDGLFSYSFKAIKNINKNTYIWLYISNPPKNKTLKTYPNPWHCGKIKRMRHNIKFLLKCHRLVCDALLQFKIRRPWNFLITNFWEKKTQFRQINIFVYSEGAFEVYLQIKINLNIN